MVSPAGGGFLIDVDDLMDDIDNLMDDIDVGFDRIMHPGSGAEPLSLGPASEPIDEAVWGDLGEIRSLFAQIAATHMGPVRDFMLELGLGDPAREWLELVLPAVRSLRKSAEGVGAVDLVVTLTEFIAALEAASSLGGSTIAMPVRDWLNESYARVVEVMPEAFALDAERDRREPVIVQSLLRQIPEVRKVALDKLYAAGLTNLTMFYVATPFDISEAAGLSTAVATRIVERFARYRRELSELTPDATRSREHSQLADLLQRLRTQNASFDALAQKWSKNAAADKRLLRHERMATVLQINLLLARLGEVELVVQLERLPFQTKADALDEYLQEAKTKYARAAHPHTTR